MKKILYIAVLFTTLTSCEKWLDVNENPNTANARIPTPEQRLPPLLAQFADAYESAGTRAAFISQQLAVTYAVNNNWNLTRWYSNESSANWPWQAWYVNAAVNIDPLIEKAEELGADAVMVVGHEGGGHLGRDDIGTMVLIPQVVDAVTIPVIASGGIGDGRGWMAAHALGAEGIEMGTRFIATKECIHASDAYKNALIASSEQDTVIIKKSIGSPARTLRNGWTDKILEIEAEHPSYEAIKNYVSGEANKKYIYEGKQEEGFGWAGQVTGLIKDVPSVQELIERMVMQAEEIRRRWSI